MKRIYRKPAIKRLRLQQEHLLDIASIEEVQSSGFENEEDDIEIDDNPGSVWGR